MDKLMDKAVLAGKENNFTKDNGEKTSILTDY